MRGLLVLGLLVLSTGVFSDDANVEGIEPYILEDQINATIEALREVLPETLAIDQLGIDLPADGIIAGGLNVSNFQLTGIKEFQVSALNLAVIGMRLNFTFVLPSINLNTNYWADVQLANLIPLYGDGKLNVHITDAELQGSAQADLTGGIAVKNLRIQLYVGDATFDVHGVLNDEDFSLIISSVLNDLIVSFIDNHQEVLSDILSPLIESIINAVLSGGDATTVAP